MNSNPNLVPTPIVDKNGKQTTVRKKADTPAKGTKLPKPSLKSTFTSVFGYGQKAKDREVLTTAIDWRLQSLGTSTFDSAARQVIMSKVSGVIDNTYLIALNNVLNRVTEDEQDREFLYDTLINANTPDNIRAIRIAGNHLEILEENPGSLQKLYRLDLIVDSYYGDVKDPLSEVDTLETHLRAKLDYPFMGTYGHSIEYEMSQAYFRTIQEHPDKAEQLMGFARSCNKEDITQPNIDFFLTVHNELPELAPRFDEMLHARGISDLWDFLEERGAYEYDKELVTAYIETAGAVNEGWL